MKKEIKVALLMAASLFIDMLDGTIVTTALPKISNYFHTSSSTAALLVSVYLITLAIFIPMSGWLANRFGKKNIWMLAVIVFTLSSLGNALSPNFEILLIMRIIQGFSAALMTPTARLIVLEKTPASQLLRMVSYLIWPALIAPAIAPIAGGFIITYWSWHWIFLINIPIGIIITFIGSNLIENDTANIKTPFDWFGFFEITAASALVLVGAELATHGSKYWIAALLMVIIGIFFGFNVLKHLKTTDNPLFSVAALKVTSFRICQTNGSVLWLSVGAMPYLLTVFLQTIFQWSPVKAGSYVLFIFLGNIGIKPFTNTIIRRLGYRGALLASFFMVLASSIALAFINAATIGILIMLLALISGVGRSLALTAFNGLNLSEIHPKDRNSANTLSSVVQTLAQGIGVSIITVVVNLLQSIAASSTAYKLGFVFLGLLMVLPIIKTISLPKDIGHMTIK